MRNHTLAVGYSGSIANLEAILAASSKVASVYTGGVAGMIRGGRPQYVRAIDELQEQVRFAHSRGITFEVALNTPCGLHDKDDTAWWQTIQRYLADLEAIGVDAVILSHPFLIDLTKKTTHLRITVSTICEITTTRSALYYERLGGDVIIPSMNANMDIAALRHMKKHLHRAALRIMVNEHCLGDCPWRRFHHSHYAHSNREIDYHANCKMAFLSDPYLTLTNSAIRPEDLRYYEDISTDFKIVGRLVPIDELVARVVAYSEQSYRGNFVDLVDSALAREINIPNEALTGLLQRKWECDKNCETCLYCVDLFSRVAVVP